MSELQQFEQIVARCQSEDNDARRQAEQVFFQTAERPDPFFKGLAQLLVSSNEIKVRSFCAVMIRQYLEIPNPAWSKVGPNSQAGVKKALLQRLKDEQERVVRLAVAGCVGSLAVKIFMPPTPGQWPELLPVLMELARSSVPACRESSLQVFEVLLDFCGEMMVSHFANLQQLFGAGLQDSDGKVKLAALKSTISLILAAPEEQLEQMQAMVPMLFHTLGQAYQNKDEDVIVDSIKVLSELACKRPKCLRSLLKQVVLSVAKMARDETLEEDTRLSAFEFLLSLAESGKGMVRKLKEFPQAVIPIAFSFMLTIEVTPEWETFEDLEDEDQRLYKAGEEGVARLADALRGKSFLPVAWNLIEQFSQQKEHWNARYTALMAIGMCAEGCEKQFKPELPKFVNLVNSYAGKDAHFRVRYAATYAIALLTKIFPDIILNTYVAVILPVLCSNMAPGCHPRLVEHTALCLVEVYNAAKNARECPEALAKHTDTVAKTLLQILGQAQHPKLKQGALAALNSMALVIGKDFERYYAGVMQAAVNILNMPATDEMQQELRGKAMETVGCAASAVGPKILSRDLGKLMPILLKDLQEHKNLAIEDPCREHLLRALGRLAETMKEEFQPYLPHIVPVLLRSAALENVARVDDGTGPNELAEKEGYITQSVNWRGLGQKRFTINTSLLEEKTLACELLYSYASSVGVAFFPYVKPAAQVLMPLINFLYNDHVRLSSISAVVPLIEVIVAHATKNKLNHDQMLRELFAALIPQVVKAAEAANMVDTMEQSLERLVDILDTLSDVINAYPLPLTQEQMMELSKLLASVVGLSIQRRTSHLKEAKENGDFDEASQEELTEYEEEEDQFLTKAYHVVAAISKKMGVQFFPIFHQYLFPVYAPLMAPARTTGERTAGLCVVGQVVNDCIPASKEYVGKFFGITMNYALDPDHDVRQSALFGLGACAMAAGPAFLPHLSQTLKVCNQVVSEPDARSEAKYPSTCCAIGAVGKIAKYSLMADPSPQNEKILSEVLTRWLSWLPAGGDEEEARQIHDMLMDLLESKQRDVWGGDQKANLPRIVAIFGPCLATDLLYPKTEERFQSLWKQLCSALSPAQLQQLCNGLPPQVQKNLVELRTIKLPRE
eukprot:gb/GEZN01000701.1/.p1 GENE.gb/GEZN01000701.1/~~gb/GEZN01000701.1/.p1  ORF type:complete len:1126 (+),score=206.16 gb/GEZN01000701.1/:56-3433(+)